MWLGRIHWPYHFHFNHIWFFVYVFFLFFLPEWSTTSKTMSARAFSFLKKMLFCFRKWWGLLYLSQLLVLYRWKKITGETIGSTKMKIHSTLPCLLGGLINSSIVKSGPRFNFYYMPCGYSGHLSWMNESLIHTINEHFTLFFIGSLCALIFPLE